MAEDDPKNQEPQDENPETPEDKPVFDPDMILENAIEDDFDTKEDSDLNDTNLDDLLEESTE